LFPKFPPESYDIEAACESYEDPQTKIFIGDQADRSFWERFKQDVPKLDIVVDDGGHEPDQQIATMEALLPHLRPGCAPAAFFCARISSLRQIHLPTTFHNLPGTSMPTTIQSTWTIRGYESERTRRPYSKPSTRFIFIQWWQ
jgi:hypothetical protein